MDARIRENEVVARRGPARAWIGVLLVTLPVAVLAVAVEKYIWPVASGSPAPTSGQLPFFIGLDILQALVLGLGVSFLIFGFSAARSLAGASSFRAWAMYLSIGWILISWWPHDNLHMHVGMNLRSLLYVEYGFHVTLMIAGLALAYCFLSLGRDGNRAMPVG